MLTSRSIHSSGKSNSFTSLVLKCVFFINVGSYVMFLSKVVLQNYGVNTFELLYFVTAAFPDKCTVFNVYGYSFTIHLISPIYETPRKDDTKCSHNTQLFS
jgi:hypothetical protein